MKHLVLLPGWGMEPVVWQPFCKQFRRHYSFSSVDWREVKTIEGYKEEVLNHIRRLDLSPCALVGWSLGALVALEVTQKHPDLISHLILIGGTSRFTADPSSSYPMGWASRIVERMKQQLIRYPQPTLNHFYTSMFSPGEQKQGYIQQWMNLIEQFRDYEIQAYVLGLDYLLQKDCRNGLEQMSTPLLCIHGEMDSICPIDAAKEIIKRKKGMAKLRSIPDAGHAPLFTAAKTCADAIQLFLGESNDD
jgi:pimeloyl-[acyl-carrier protein] methyl ester esterase